MKNNKTILGALVPLIMMMSGCATQTMDQAESEFDSTSEDASSRLNIHKRMSESATAVSEVNELYIAGGAIKINNHGELPSFFHKRVVFNQLDPISFQEMIGMISSDVKARINLSSDAISFLEGKNASGNTEKKSSSPIPVDSSTAAALEPMVANDIDFAGLGLVGSNLTFSLEHSGTVASLLDTITSKANLFWRWEKDHIEIFRSETKSFVFDADDVVTEFNAQTNSSQEATSEGATSSGGGSSSKHGTSVSSKPVSIYDELDSAIKSMVSPSGTYSISRSMGDVTVTDTPKNLERIQSYIEDMNRSINKRIAIRAEVYEITSDDDGNFGIDWNAVNTGSSRFSMSMNTAFNSSTTPNMSLGIIDSGSNYNGTKAFVNMLNKQVKTSLVTSASVFTTNGQPVPVQVADQKSYLKQISVESDATTGAKTYSMEPGVVMSGFSMSVNPRVMSDGKVSMRFAVDMSQLNEIVDFSVGDKDDGSKIQLPDKTSKNFVQRVTVGSGQTMMIAGFERAEVNAKTTSLAGKNSWFAGGSRSGGNKKVMTMILLTPYIMAK